MFLCCYVLGQSCEAVELCEGIIRGFVSRLTTGSCIAALMTMSEWYIIEGEKDAYLVLEVFNNALQGNASAWLTVVVYD